MSINIVIFIIICILLFLLNASFLDRLFLGRKSNWIPFYMNPKKWHDVFLADENEPNIPTFYRGNYSSNANYTGTIHETSEETERRKEFFRQQREQEVFSSLEYISEFQEKQIAKKKGDDQWLKNIQVHGCITILSNLVFMAYLLFFRQ